MGEYGLSVVEDFGCGAGVILGGLLKRSNCGGIDSDHPGLHPFGATLCVVQNYILVVLSNPLRGFSSRAEYK